MKFFYLVFFLLYFVLGSCASNEKQVKKAELHHKLALSLIKKCKYRMALAELQQALKFKSQDPLIHHSIALLYFQFTKYQKTLAHLRTALELKPDFTDARVYLGRSLVEMGQWEAGLKELKKAKEDLTYRYPERIHIHTGMAYYRGKKYKEAEKHFNVVRTMKKTDCFSALYHAQSLYFAGRFQESLKILEPSKKFCKVAPPCSKPSFDSYYFSAQAYDKMGQKQKALFNLKTFLDKAHSDNPYRKKAEQTMRAWRNINPL